MILLIVDVARVLGEEAEGAQLGIGGAEHLRGIAAILVGIHHRQVLRLERHTGRHGGRDTGGHRLVAARLDEDDAVTATGTVEGRAVAHHRHLLDVAGIQAGENVVVESLVEQLTAVLLLDDDIVDHNEGLCVGVQRVQTLNEHHATHARRAVAADGVYLTAQLLLDFLLDVKGVGIGEVGHRAVATVVGRCGVFGIEEGAEEFNILLLLAFLQADAHGVVVGSRHHDRRAEHRHLQFVGTVVLGEYAIALDLGSTHDGAADGLAGGSVEHLSAHGTGLILLFLNLEGGYRGLALGFLRLVVLRPSGNRNSQQGRSQQAM